MTGIRTICLALVVAATAVVVGPPAAAAPTAPPPENCKKRGGSDCGCVNPTEGGVTCVIRQPNPGSTTPPSGGTPGRGGGTAPTAYWRGEQLFRQRGGGGGAPTPVEWNCYLPDGRETGQIWSYTLIDAATGAQLTRQQRCVDPVAATPAAQGFAAPPTTAELRSLAKMPQLTLGREPLGRGMTGMESWFWAEGEQSVTVNVTLQGWTVTGTMRATTWRWNIGGTPYTTSTSGSAANPAVGHTFQRKGRASIGLTVSWSGSYTVSGYGISYTVPGLAATTASAAGYDVIESVPELVTP